MAELKFKYGPYSNLCKADGSANLAQTPLAEGTVYVTTDERAMFVDLKPNGKSTTERIRIEGSVQYYDSVETFTATTNPPYNQNTLYFFRKINNGDNASVNALMAYDGSKWVQINVTLDAFEQLGANVGALTTSVTQLSEALTALTTRVKNAEDSIKEHGTAIGNLETRLGEEAAKVSTLQGDMTQAKADIVSNKGLIDGLTSSLTAVNNTVTNHGTRIGNLESDMSTAKSDISTLKSDLDAAEKAIEDNEKAIGENATAIGENKANITTLTTNVSSLAQRMSAAETKNTNQDNAINQLQTDLDKAEDTISGHGTQLADHDSRIKANADAIAEHASTLNTHGTNITNLSAGVQTNAGNITQLQKDLDAAEGTIGQHTEQIGALRSDLTDTNGRVTQAETDINNLEDAVGGIQTSLNSLATKKQLEDLNADLSAGISKNAQDIAKNKSDIADNATEIGELWDAIGGSGSGGSSLSGRLDTAEDDIDALQAAVQNIVSVNNTQGTAIENNANDISGLKTRMDTAESDIDSLEGRMGTAESDIDSLEGRMDDAETNINTLSTAVTNLQSTKADKTEVEKQIGDLEDALTDEINDKINAANSMTFMGTKSSSDDLPTSNVRVGDTWVMNGTGSYSATDTTVEYSAGDFFIATGSEDADTGYITGTITWNHVKSGYDSAFDPTVKSVVTTNQDDPSASQAVIAMYNFAGAGLGAVTLASDSKNIQLTGSGTDNNKTVGISLVWDTF